MNVTLSPDTQKLIEERMKGGGYTTPEEVIRAGLASWKKAKRMVVLGRVNWTNCSRKASGARRNERP